MENDPPPRPMVPAYGAPPPRVFPRSGDGPLDPDSPVTVYGAPPAEPLPRSGPEPPMPVYGGPPVPLPRPRANWLWLVAAIAAILAVIAFFALRS